MLEGSATLAKSYSAPIASAQFDWRCYQIEDVGPKAIATATVTLSKRIRLPSFAMPMITNWTLEHSKRCGFGPGPTTLALRSAKAGFHWRGRESSNLGTSKSGMIDLGDGPTQPLRVTIGRGILFP